MLAPGWAARLRAPRVPRGVAEALAVPAAAALATAPVIAALSGGVSLVTVPANLLAAPGGGAGHRARRAGRGRVAGVQRCRRVAGAAGRVAGRAGWPRSAPERRRCPGATLSWPGGVTGGLVLAAALGPSCRGARRRLLRRLAWPAPVGAAVVLIRSGSVAPGWPPAGWLFVACSVGQGDALVVRAGAGAAVVVDAGPEPVAVDGCLRRLGVRAVPLLVLSHLHADHVGGLAGVLRGRAVGEIDVGPAREPAAAWREVERLAAARGVPVRTAAVGERRELGGAVLDVLGPTRPTAAPAPTRTTPRWCSASAPRAARCC